jgi:putative membrane protein (TIGR04086 family)
MKRNQEKGDRFGSLAAGVLIKCLLFAYILTALFLALLAFLVDRAGLGEKAVSAAITAIYVAATFLAGFLAGKRLENRKFLWGLLEGLAYFCILAAVSFLWGSGEPDAGRGLLTTLILCLAGGMLGGMLG